MSTETRINVGAVIGMGMLLVTVMVFQSSSTNARIDRLDTRVEGLRVDVNTRFDRLDTRIDGLDARIDGQDTRIDRLDARVDSLRSDMREDHAALVARLDAFQGILAEILQRLAHIEGRLGMPRGGDAEAAPGN